jgi:phage anti-repressor protein
MKNITNFTQENALTLFNSADDFPVDFELAWEWLGFSRKDTAKESLTGGIFEEGRDFLYSRNNQGIEKIDAKTAKSINKKAGEQQKIWLTIDCFKTWGMMAATERGKEVRKYFLACERELKAISSSRREWVLADVLENDMFAAAAMGMSMTFKSLAEEKGVERTNKEFLNYADLAQALFLVSMAAQPEEDEPESDEDAEFNGAEAMDNLRWTTMVRDAFATLHPAAAAKWLMDMAEKDPKSYYLKGLPGISAIAGYRQAVEIPAALPVIDRREIAQAAARQQKMSVEKSKAITKKIKDSIAPYKDSIE